MAVAATPDEVTEARRPYHPRGAAVHAMLARDPELVISGAAGTGKSRACLEKLHLCAEKYPGMRGLIVRKTRVSLTESALVTWEEKVVPEGHPALGGARRANRQAYHYPNGSVVVVGGLDRPTRIMSTEYSMAYVQEAIELSESEWEALTTRLRHGAMPYLSLLADTNPDAPTHWLKKRCDAGRARMLHSAHEDNPLLWDAAAGAWTAAGLKYLAKLDSLTGNRLQRLRHGRWVQAEGVVYPEWDAAVHVIDRFPIPPEWPRYWAIDFGYTAPFACLFFARDPDGRLYLYREVYHTGRLVEDHARRINALVDRSEPRPSAVVCDHAREERGAVEKYLGVSTTPARKDITSGIQLVAARLRKAGDGRPRLFVLRGSLVERDAALAEAGKPCSVAEEFDSYCWADPSKAGRKGEVPMDGSDHGMDCIRYLCSHLDRPGPDWGVRIFG